MILALMRLWLLALPTGDIDVSLADLHALPPHAVAAYNSDLGQKHLEWVVSQRDEWTSRDPNGAAASYFWAWWLEADWHAGVWSLLTGATNEDFGEIHRLDCLRRLREQLGREAYYGGRLPSPVPLARFQEKQ